MFDCSDLFQVVDQLEYHRHFSFQTNTVFETIITDNKLKTIRNPIHTSASFATASSEKSKGIRL